jgi:TRAP-type C4-dicarboxylate transport system permease small subunit
MGLHQNGWIGTAVLAGISSLVSCALGTALIVVVGLNFANVISRYGF